MLFEILLFWLCLFIPRETHGYSAENLIDRLQSLENKMVVMSEKVAQLTSENEDLKTRVKQLEELISNGQNAKVQLISASETKENPVNGMNSLVERHNSQEMESIKNQKRVGNYLNSFSNDNMKLNFSRNNFSTL